MFNNIRKTVNGESQDRAVSPVIGVILMVAITVILAAVIATMVIGMGDDIGDNPQAGVQTDVHNSSAVGVSVTDMANADGVLIVNSDGDIAYADDASEEAHLSSTGSSATFAVDDTESEMDIGEDSYTIQAYIGGDIDDADIDAEDTSVDDVVDSTAVVGDFELEE